MCKQRHQNLRKGCKVKCPNYTSVRARKETLYAINLCMTRMQETLYAFYLRCREYSITNHVASSHLMKTLILAMRMIHPLVGESKEGKREEGEAEEEEEEEGGGKNGEEEKEEEEDEREKEEEEDEKEEGENNKRKRRGKRRRKGRRRRRRRRRKRK
jgi:hypothetical protein